MSTPKNPAAVALGRRGGRVRNPKKGMGSATPQERKERAAKMLAARWGNRLKPSLPSSP